MKNLQKEYRKRRRLHRRLRFQSKLINVMNRAAFYVLVLLACAAAYALSFPQYKAMEEKEMILAEAKEEERLAMLRKDKAVRKNRAIQEDSRYMELVARDTLDYYKPGEIVFDVNRNERSQEDEK